MFIYLCISISWKIPLRFITLNTCKSYCLVCCFLKGGIHLCESARYTIAEYHRLDGMNNRNLLLSSGDWIKYSQIQFPPEDPVSVSRCLPSHCVLTAETERETHTERKRLRWGQGRGRERKSSLAIPSYKNTRTSGYHLNLTTSQRNHLHHHIGHPGFNMWLLWRTQFSPQHHLINWSHIHHWVTTHSLKNSVLWLIFCPPSLNSREVSTKFYVNLSYCSNHMHT